MADNEDWEEGDLAVFEEPANFRPPSPPPTFQNVPRELEDIEAGQVASFRVRLVGKHSLWAHWLWNAGRTCAQYLDKHKYMCRGKYVLELGAAAALPSFVAAVNGASKVVITDFPEPVLVKNIEYNVEHNLPPEISSAVAVEGFIWGHDPSALLAYTHTTSSDASAPPSTPSGFDLIILADLIFNHTEHERLLKSCRACLNQKDGLVFVTFTHHVPKKAHMDMAFFDRAREQGFTVEKILEVKAKPMFENDEGDIEMRSTVHGYFLSLKNTSS
ncbi:hypothetical protein M427DRAFT_28681 [Gonapodya prolifera JEL478]|uniref:Protein N-terminal and lysine N-methyltransferase EFM7 n=1 Tax=Gonapodya prolifera (strain JEL478) TaxID=1344416 RepID=A0A139ASP5_GONPJ|nr:hypothetical protein M427DRAFT_28681 [Gonapodya prolifera JEL478]|eukprot:KXS19768.1 hypothetical protein M427DRAFT_28681 [Gonapodya prolifera JEL478]